MNSTDSTTRTRHCLGCGRKITSPESIATGRGKSCRAKVRKALKAADLSAWKPEQIEDAREAIEDGAVVPTSRPDVFNVVSTDGAEIHMTHPSGCNCAAGLRTRHPRPCWHRAAVAIVMAAQTAVEDETPANSPYALAA